MDEKTTKGMLEFVIEIERLPYTDKESWFSAMETFQSMHNLAQYQTPFEVFEDADERRAEVTTSQLRLMQVAGDNIIPGARIVEFDLDKDGDLYYAKIHVPDNPEARGRINMGKGKFIPRLLAHTEEVEEDGVKKNISKVGVMFCLDFVWKKGENVDEDSSGGKEPHEGSSGIETPDTGGANSEA